MNLIQLYILFSLIYFSSLTNIIAQSLPDYRGNLQSGNYSVGFKSICVYDTSRKYDLTCGDTSIVINHKNNGRPVLINMWYPAVIKNKNTIRIKDFFDFPFSEDTKLFFKKLNDFQYKNAKLYAVDENMTNKESITIQISVRICSNIHVV